MGLKENLLTDLKGCTVEYQGKKLYVVEQFNFKNEIYLCTLDLEEIPEAAVIFLKKKTSSIYEYINDEKLCDKLFERVGAIVVQNEIEKIKKEIGM